MPKTDAPVVNVQVQPARRQRRGDRDADHQAHRGSRQHHQRHRRAARDLRPGQRRASPSPSRSSATSKSATQDVRDKLAHDRQPVPARHPAAADHRRWIPTRSRSSASPSTARARRRRSPRSPTSGSSRCSRRSKDVGSVGYNGERKREIQLLLNADRLNAYGLTVDQVRTAVAAAERRDSRRHSSPPGRPRSRCARWAASSNVEDFNRIVLAYRATAR